MRRFGLTAVALILVCTSGAILASGAESLEGLEVVNLPCAVEGTAWSFPLMPFFESAARQYDVPLPLLLVLGYFGSAFENRGGAPTIEGGYGVMALRQNELGGESLAFAASLTGESIEALKLDPAANIHGAAAVLDSTAKSMGIDRSKGLQAWLDVVIKYAGLDEENSRFFAMEVFEKLSSGLDCVNSSGERFRFDPQDIGSIDLKSLEPPRIGVVGGPPILQSADYPPAIWDPAPTCNYSTTWTNKDTIVVHTIEGTAAGARSWFKNCNSSVSAHYVIAENGTIWQMVREGQVAWHVSCYNSRSIGLEHEGYAASPSHPQSLYDASALLARDICNDWGIPKEKRTVGPGILGHIDVTRCCCGTHTDPGSGWDWNYYIQQVQGTPPPPTWAASYHAQSYPSTMTAGETAIAWVEYVNNGTGTWTHGSTRLGTSSPQDRASPFYNSDNWIGPNRPTDVDQSSVTQGQIGRFTFILKAPSTPGVYVEHYRPVQEGVTWFGDEVTWTITVNPAKGGITGTVRNAANAQPISGATVSISGGPSTSTNGSGVYTFNGIDAGNYTLTATASGFNPASAPVTVNPGQTTTQDFSLTPTDTQPPTAPANLTATAVSPSQINLAWTASADNVGVVEYKIYRNGVEIGSTASTSFQDNGLSANTTYGYFVRARDAANNLSNPSNTAYATTYPGEVPIFEDGFANLDYWENIVQSPMPGEYPPVIDSSRNRGAFCGANSIRTRTSSDPNQGCLIGHRFEPAFGAARFETYFFDGSGAGYIGDMECGTDGWVGYPQSYATISTVPGGITGYCLDANDGGWTAGAYREIASGFAAGESYSLSMWSKWPGGSYSTPPRCFVRFFDSAGTEIRTDYSQNITTDNAWHPYSVTGTIPSGTAKIWIGHWGVRSVTERFDYYADGVVFTSGAGAAVNNASRQGLQVRCLDGNNGVKAIYYVGTYSAAPGSQSTYSVGYYKVCGSGCTGWYWPGAACKTRTAGWHKFVLDFLPYTGSGDVKAYIDGELVCTMDRTPDTQTYGLNMVAYGFHYRVNVESWFDDCAMYATQPHPAPTMGAPQALGPTSLRWHFTDNSSNEAGFRLIDSASRTMGVCGALSGTGGAGYIDEGGLTPNTPYTRIIRAFNGSLDSWNSSSATRWTLSTPPSTSNVTCNKPAGVWSGSAQFIFTAVGGFGAGTVSGYSYAWDQSPTHSFSGTEPVWNSGDLVLTAASAGSWYLHLRGFNGEQVPNGTLDLGPYRFDGTPPRNPTAAAEVHGAPNGAWQSNVSDPAFTWTGAFDNASGIAGYLVYFGTDEQGTSGGFVSSASFDPAPVDTGTYYLRVRARDAAGNYADEWATLFTFKYDASAPPAPVVADDGPYSGSKTKIHAQWSADDPESGISEFSFAVGTSAGADDVVGWTSCGSSREAVISIPEPGLSVGPTYYVSVKARNGAGAWSAVGSSDGIQLAPNAGTIAHAKSLADGVPVALENKIVTAAFPGCYYVEESDRTSGILVLGVGPDVGAAVTIGGLMGLNSVGERAILSPVAVVELPPDPSRVPRPLFLASRRLGGADFNAYTPGASGGIGLNNVGLLVTVSGRVTGVGDHELVLSDGSSDGAIKVISPGGGLGGVETGDYVIATGISSLERVESDLKPVVRLRGPEGIRKL